MFMRPLKRERSLWFHKERKMLSAGHLKGSEGRKVSPAGKASCLEATSHSQPSVSYFIGFELKSIMFTLRPMIGMISCFGKHYIKQ